MKRLPIYFIFLFCSLFHSGCATIFTDYQGAKITPPGNVEVTPNFTGVMFSDNDSDNGGLYQQNAGIRAAIGIHERLEIRALFETFKLDNDNSEFFNYNAIGFGPKFSILKDKLSLYVPFGFAMGDNIETKETVESHPTLLYTFLSEDKLEVNSSAKMIFPFNSDRDILFAFNLGFGAEITNYLTLRPATAILINPGESGYFISFGLGASFKLSVIR